MTPEKDALPSREVEGGAPGSGGPRGERNGRYRTGLHTAEAVEERRSRRAGIWERVTITGFIRRQG
jgi:hypothetical protein